MTNEPRHGVSFSASGFDRGGMEAFVEVLRALGLDADAEFSSTGRTARVQVRDLPERWEAERTRTRYAGRRSTGVHPPAGSIFNSDTPCTEFLEWQESHTAAEGMAQLGLSRSTYFRRMRQMRERVAEQERINRARDGSANWDGGTRLVVRLGDLR